VFDGGVYRVVIAARDPHPFASGVGLERLRAAGVRVEIGLLEAEARAQNAAFFAAVEKD
jgi:diaminohydroxyphosphoribosylaminopyrimidine deaminase/5-amino-6-(5-phosphoribosylamino)uracil reductase